MLESNQPTANLYSHEHETQPQQQLYPMHEFGPVPRTYRRPGVLYPRLDYETGITR